MFDPAYPVRVDGALDMGGTDPGSTLSLGNMPESSDIR